MITQCNGSTSTRRLNLQLLSLTRLKKAQESPGRTWLLGNDEIAETTECKHLGVMCDKFMSLDGTIKSESNKLKSTFLSLINSGIYEDGFNPLTSVHMYKTAVIPKALYGCELWSDLLPKHVLNIERAHRFCAKFIQFLPRNTNTEVVLSLIGINPIEADIDYRKLTFFGQLCRLPGCYRVKEVFLHRLFNFTNSLGPKYGFIPDLFHILNKYSLGDVLDMYTESGVFMSKFVWKKIIREKIDTFYKTQLLNKITHSDSLSRILRVHTVISIEPHILWQFSKTYPCYRKSVQMAVRLIGMLFCGRRLLHCGRCNEPNFNMTEHILLLLLFCSCTETFRIQFWSRFVTTFGIGNFNELKALTPASQVDAMLSGCSEILDDISKCYDCLKLFMSSLKFINNQADVNFLQII